MTGCLDLRHRLLLLAFASALLSANPARAQGAGAAAPPGGLFGQGPVTDARNAFHVSLSLVELYDNDNLRRTSEIVSPLGLEPDGYSTMLSANADYALNHPRVQLAAGAASVLRYYNELDDVKALSHSAGVGLSARLGGRTTLIARQTAAYSPSYLFGLFPRAAEGLEGAPPAGPDYEVYQTDSYTYLTTVGITRGLSPRNAVSLTTDAQYTDFRNDETNRDMRVLGAAGEFTRNLSANTIFRTRYQFQSGNVGTADDEIREHEIDLGLDYTRALSATRSAGVSFRLGASSAARPTDAPGSDISGDYRALVGAMSASYAFSRAWLVRADYNRGYQFVAGFREPIFSDGISGGLDGLVSRRIDLSVFGGYARGRSAFETSGTDYSTYTADFRFRYALSSNTAVYAQYIYFFYDFGANLALTPGIPFGNLERNGLRLGLTMRVSALRR